MSQEVTVHVGRDGPQTLEATASLLETRGGGSFDLVLENHGTPIHVHCHLAGDIARVASLEVGNHYVDADETVVVPVHVPDVGHELGGTLEVSTGYGANAVTIGVAATTGSQTAVDETLATPRTREPEPSALESVAASVGLDPATLAVLGLGLLAVAVAVSTAAVVGSEVAVLGVLIVGAGVLVALWLLLE
ncbi:DUF7524 family protein [Natronobiforma cellulositropha]|uniref:DUF7524 family protein n=1 Tax=Natronobiforma cellulositropha TaxID=1679076 RepID=UPI0021D5AC41|nr:hypothetical protein [Natronobiforma cellulositropha]